MSSNRVRRVTTRALAVVGLTLALSACTPQQFASWLSSIGVNPNQYSQAQLEQGAAAATAIWDRVIADYRDLTKFDHVLTEDQLWRLRQCESGGNYAAVSPGGHYRGAYQFSPSTWNSVAGRHYPAYVGVDPAVAPSKVQDSMARALFSEAGRSPWPVCGQRI